MRSTGGAAMSERILVRPEAKARQVDYLVEHLNARLLEEPGTEDEVKRAYWAQMIASLYRGLEENEQRAKLRH